MLTESLIDRTLSLFPRLSGEIVIEPVEKGGSDRKYYRMRMSDAHSMILVKYGHHREENRHYVSIARFLQGLHVRVPEIFFHDDQEGLIWMEDLGCEDLWFYREAAWPIRRDLYVKSLDQVLKLHTPAALASVPADLTLQNGFDNDLYLWEQDYFFENCLRRHFGFGVAEVESSAEKTLLGEIARRLAEEPPTLVHRDFQSQNILICEGEACLIDFQGLRAGLPQYDLASLLYDPYVELSNGERRELLDHYLSAALDSGAFISKSFEEVFNLCALQRLMQALGAYGFLGHVRGHSAFLQHIPAALRSLQQVLHRIGTFPELCRLIERCA